MAKDKLVYGGRYKREAAKELAGEQDDKRVAEALIRYYSEYQIN